MHRPPLETVVRWLATLGLASCGALVAMRIGTPLPWLLGGLLAMVALNLSRLTIAGHGPAMPAMGRAICVPIIGVLIGSAFTADLLQAALGWWRPLLAVLLFVPLAHAIAYRVLTRIGRLDPATAFFGAMPGGLIEAVELGEAAGGDIRRLTILHSARVAVIVTVVPLIFSLIQGGAVGSAAGETFGPGASMGLIDAILLVGCAWLGLKAARRIRMPAAQLLGPLMASALVHGLGLTHAAPPGWVVAAAQLVIGTTLGLRLTGLAPRELARMIGLAAICVAATLVLGAMFAAVLSGLGVARMPVMVLSLAPGGVVEMGLVALSLQASPIFITAMHMARLFLTVMTASAAWSWLQSTARH